MAVQNAGAMVSQILVIVEISIGMTHSYSVTLLPHLNSLTPQS